MNANGVVTNEFTALVRTALANIADYTDGPVDVKLVETAFDPKVKASYPVGSAAFDTLNSTGAWDIEYDAVTGRWYLVAPDPADGWDFVSLSGGVSIVGFVVSGAAEYFCGNMFENPIPVGAAGEHINLPWVALDITQLIIDAITPYPLP